MFEPDGFFDRDVRYKRWDGTQRLDALEADELLGAMSDELLSGGDLEDAMARLARWGIPGRMEGLKDFLGRLRMAKQGRAQRHDLSKTFDQLKEKLEEVKRLEREGLDRRRKAPAPNEQLRAAMEKLAAPRIAQLHEPPDACGRAMRSLWQSMSAGMRSQLEELLGAAFNDPGLQAAMNELAETLGQLMPMEGYEHAISGDEPLTLAEALGLMDEMNQLSDMEDVVRSARNSEDLSALDREQVEQLAGPSAKQALDDLRRMTQLLEEAGLIRKDGDRYELTPRGIRKIGQRSLEEIFATLKKDAFGGHRAKARGRGGDPTDELKTYEFGDPFLLDLPGTVRNAVMRDGAAVPVKLAADDFDVYRTELVTQSATAILVDVSRSMLFRGCFLAAKKVTLALDSLIRSTFPKDDLYIVGFSAYAQELKPTDLPRLTWNEYVYGTNMQHAFETARTLLSRSRGKNKQIILITDGEPTAYFEPGSTYPQFNYPPTKRTFEATLREVVRCTRESITINTFMLARGHYLVDFVNQMSKINNGRAFYVEPEHLGEYVLVDYVSHKRRRVS